MKILNLTQGTPEWNAHRAQHRNASDSPVVMGCSPYKTREEFIRELATGIKKEFSPQQQAILNSGHRFEGLARPLGEKTIGEDLFPVVGVAEDGKHSASFDGLTMLEDVGYEHKRLNKRLREAMFDGCTGADLPMDYQVQMESQCNVCPTIEKVLFMASEWDDNDTLIEERHCWYTPNLELRARINAAWDQIEADVAAYEPTAAAAPAPLAKVVAHLPIVFDMRVEGKLVSCNLKQYKPAALQYIAEINTKLVTDQHFADAEADAKFCRDSAAKLKMAVKQAIGQMGDINTAIETVEEIAKAFDAKGLSLEKLVRSEKDTRREEIVSSGVEALRSHLESLNKRLGKMRMPPVPADFGGAVKGKRNLDSMRDAVNTELARAKIAANEIADKIQANLTTLRELASDFVSLFPDAATIVLKAPDDLTTLVKSRIAEYKAKEEARLEAQREQIRKEEQERADREAREKLAQQEREAEAKRQEEERARRETLLQNEKAAQADIEQAVQKGELAAPLAQDIRAIQDDLTAAPVTREAISNAQRTAAAAPAAPAGPPTLRIGAIADRLGWSMTAEQMRALGIEPAAKERGSVLYHESQFPALCDAIARRALEAKAAHGQHATA